MIVRSMGTVRKPEFALIAGSAGAVGEAPAGLGVITDATAGRAEGFMRLKCSAALAPSLAIPMLAPPLSPNRPPPFPLYSIPFPLPLSFPSPPPARRRLSVLSGLGRRLCDCALPPPPRFCRSAGRGPFLPRFFPRRRLIRAVRRVLAVPQR